MRKKRSCGGALKSSLPTRPRIVIAGAGAIGCFVGGMLQNAGADVSFLGRPRILDSLRAQGLRLTDYSGLDVALPAASLDLHETPKILGQADVVLVCVKSAATAELARVIAAHAPAHAIIVSLQNGMGHAATLRAALPARDIRAGMVPFNVVPMAQGVFHRATSGDIVIAQGETDLAGILSVAAMVVTQDADIKALQWGKFLLNLNNAPNALSGMALHAQLLDRDWRRLMADQMREALMVLRAQGCVIKSTTGVPPGLVPYILRLPTPLFKRVAARMLTIDPQARTSMAYDLSAGRPTEVDAFQGRIIEMAQAHGIAAPVCARVLAAVKQAEAVGLTPHSPDRLRG